MQPIKDLGNGKYLLRAKTEPDAEGICHSKSKTVEAKNWQDAERQLRILIREAAKAKPATKKERKNKKMSVSELMDSYIVAKRIEGKSDTYLDKIECYRKRIDEAFKGRTITDLTVARIDKFSQNLTQCTNRHDEKAHKKSGGKGQVRQISEHYKYQIQALLLRAIKWADKKGYMTDNVTHRITKLPKGEYEQIEIPDTEVIQKFIEYLDKDDSVDDVYKIFINLVSWCGLRTEEILGLTWNDVNFTKKQLRIDKAVVKVTGKGRVEKGPKSKSSKRNVIMPQKIIRMLTTWKELCEKESSVIQDSELPAPKIKHVIINPANGSLPHPDTFSHWLRKYLRRHEFNHVTPHGLRHFYATYLIIKGVDIKTVSKLAGHKDITTTLQIYTAVTQEGFNKAESVLNAI